VEWQTRTFEGRVGKPVRVQIPPSAPNLATRNVNRYSLNGKPILTINGERLTVNDLHYV
jgi:hypothetical protein